MVDERAPRGNKVVLPADFNEASRFIRERRKAEGTGSEIAERTRKLLELIENGSFGRWKTAGILVSTQLDPNGLRIDAGPETENGIHSHIPYAMMRVEHARMLWDHACVDDLMSLELAANAARAAGDIGTLEKITSQQEHQVSNALNSSNLYTSGSVPPEDARRNVLYYLVGAPHYFKSAYPKQYIPSETLQEFLREPLTSDQKDRTQLYLKTPVAEKVMKLASIAEDFNVSGKERDVLSWISDDAFEVLKNTHKHAELNKEIFEKRSKTLHQPENYEVAKIIRAIFEHADPESVRSGDVRMVRGKYKDGLEFLGIWRGKEYSRILLDPDTFLSKGSRARAHYDDLPSIKRSEFESLEALMLPFRFFNRFAWDAIYPFVQDPLSGTREIRIPKEDDQFLEKAKKAGGGLIRLAVTDLHHFHKSLLQTHEALFGHGGKMSEDNVRNYVQAIDAASDAYTSAFNGREASEILAEKAPIPFVRKVTLDQSFIDGMPEEMRKKGRNFNQTVSVSGRSIKIVESGPHGLHYAHEGRAMRALGLKPRPIITTTGGAAQIDKNSQSWNETEAAVGDTLDVSFELTTNTMGPGSQAGIGLILPNGYYARLDKIAAENRDSAARLFAVEPGQDIYYPGNPYPEAAAASSWAISPIDTIVTPYPAGWSSHGTASLYHQHILYRQGLAKRASEGFRAANVIINGGSWTIMENVEALKDGFPVVIRSGTGRFADLMTLGIAREAEWRDMSDAGKIELFKKLAEDVPADRERLHADLSQEFYQHELLRFLRYMRTSGDQQNVFVADRGTYKDTLRRLLR